jgi:hypothetical protein
MLDLLVGQDAVRRKVTQAFEVDSRVRARSRSGALARFLSARPTLGITSWTTGRRKRMPAEPCSETAAR